MAGFLNAVAHALSSARTSVVQACQAANNPLPPPVAPTIAIAAPKIVLVKKGYQAEGHRLRVKIGTTGGFTGTGTLTGDARIRLYDAAGTLIPWPYAAIPGGALTAGIQLFVEAVSPSAALSDVTLTLTLTQGGEPLIANPATDTLTCVEVTLDLCVYKPVPGGADPAPMGGDTRVTTGRNIHLQTDKLYAGRAMIVVHQAVPAAYHGSVVLRSLSDRVRIFPHAHEVPAVGQVAQALPLSTANAAIPAAGIKLWVEGSSASRGLLDTGFRLEISDLPRREGDRANITVVQTRLDVCKSRKSAGTVPTPIADSGKMDPGRYLHVQDGGNHHGRARVALQRVKPAAFNGNLEATVWDVTANGLANPRLRLFAAELPGGAGLANPYPLAWPGGFPAIDEAELWAEGALVSGGLRDTELRLKVSDAEGWADRAALTVCEFYDLRADIPSTPAVTNRAGNSPVPRHEWRIANPASAAKDFDEDYVTNAPFVLMENSVKDTDRVQLSVQVRPAGVPVRWDTIRDRRPIPDGDNVGVIGLSGNKEAPTLGSKAEGATNTLLADAVGSFHICPFVDCNGSEKFDFMAHDGTRIDREPFIMMNAIVVRVKAVANNSVGQRANCSPFGLLTAAGFGGFSTSSAAAGANWTGADSGWHADATVDVIGGGSNGRRGLDKVFGGWIQHIFLNGIRAEYRIPAPGLSPRSHQYAFVSNLPDPNHPGEYHYIGAAEVAANPADAGWCINTPPALDPSNILDVTPYPDSGTGGDSAVGSTGSQGGTTGNHGGGYPAPVNQAIGQRWRREMWDAPGIGCASAHISAGGSLSRFRFNLGFRTDLCFWTNTDAVPDATATGVANRLYVTVYKCKWTPDFEVRFDRATGAGRITKPAKIKVTKEKSKLNGTARPFVGLETRSPIALHWYAVDART